LREFLGLAGKVRWEVGREKVDEVRGRLRLVDEMRLEGKH
jgi:hypothetical protein